MCLLRNLSTLDSTPNIYLLDEIRFVNQASIGTQIRKIRESKDLSQENVAEELGITKGSLSKIENGATNVPVTRLIQIAKVLGVGIAEFFKTSQSSNKAEDPSKQYGFATKGDVEELMKMIDFLKSEISFLKSKVEELETAKKPILKEKR